MPEKGSTFSFIIENKEIAVNTENVNVQEANNQANLDSPSENANAQEPNNQADQDFLSEQIEKIVFPQNTIETANKDHCFSVQKDGTK